MGTKKSNTVNVSPGEALSYNDLLDIQKALTQRAWEVPGYSDALSAMRFLDGVGSYAGAFAAPANIAKIVFTKGAGLYMPPPIGFNLLVYDGFAGIYNGTTDPGEFSISSPNTKMRWAINSQSPSLTTLAVGNPGGGGASEQYSLIEATITEATSEVATRHFKDSATGALSTAATAKRRSLTLNFFVNDGFAAAVGSGTLPALTAGRSLVGYTRQTSAGIQEVYDCTVPFGPIRERVLFSKDAILSGNFVAGTTPQTITSPGFGATASYFPMGDPRERLVGFSLLHAMNGVCSVSLLRTEANTTVALAAKPFTLTSAADFTADGTQRELFVNTLGPPIATGGVIKPPVWGGGHYHKHDGSYATYSNESLNLAVSAAGASSIYGLRVFSIVG